MLAFVAFLVVLDTAAERFSLSGPATAALLPLLSCRTPICYLCNSLCDRGKPPFAPTSLNLLHTAHLQPAKEG